MEKAASYARRRPSPIYEKGALLQLLEDLRDEHGTASTDFRKQALNDLKDFLKTARGRAEEALAKDGRGWACAKSLSDLQDELIIALFDFCRTHVYPAVNPSDAERISLVAVGGYGRGTLAPQSDIDLLFVWPYKQTAWGESVVEYVLYFLWDLGFKVGHATRSIDECIRLARSDSTILTAVLEARYIAGDKPLFEELKTRFRADAIEGEAEAFIADKLAERDLRHKRSGESRYLVEPDVKDGKGGLRDLHTLFWIAKFVYGSDRASALVGAGVFSRTEFRRFVKSEDFLWAVRCHLHFLTGRPDDRLSFDKQAELAERLGYSERDGLNHVERFMRHYFLTAKDVGDLTRIFCAVLEARQMKLAPRMSRLFEKFRRRRGRKLKETDQFRLESGRINIATDTVFNDDPVNLLRLFELAEKHDVGIHPAALQQVRRSLKLLRKPVRIDPEANRIFVDLLIKSRDPESILRRMNEAGVLGRFIPDFGKIVAMMQFNMYHHYTVDEHLLRAVGILSEIEHGSFGDEHPLASDIFGTLKSRRALYVAVLLHDIAKGRKEDHSIAGERVAKSLCPRLGLTAAETDTVAWLVRHHLLMSETAQMRDLNDYKTILDFAAVVQSPERLKLLLILTVADIRAVGPGVWNGWKGQLLRTLYFEAEPVLSGGHSSVSRATRVEAAKAKFAERMPDWSAAEIEAYQRRHYDPYWLNVDVEHQVKHAKLIAAADKSGEPVAIETASDEFTAITEITVLAPDHPRLLALLTGACAAGGANIAGAQIFTTADGMAIDTLLVQRAFEQGADEDRRAKRIAELIRKALTGEVRLRDLMGGIERPTGRIKAFDVEPQVIIDNDSSNSFTVIEVNGLDRIGLLYDLTEALFRLNLNIASAHITTFGEKAVDVFYVTDLTGAKITNASRRAAIQRHLLVALAPNEPDKLEKAS